MDEIRDLPEMHDDGSLLVRAPATEPGVPMQTDGLEIIYPDDPDYDHWFRVWEQRQEIPISPRWKALHDETLLGVPSADRFDAMLAGDIPPEEDPKDVRQREYQQEQTARMQAETESTLQNKNLSQEIKKKKAQEDKQREKYTWEE